MWHPKAPLSGNSRRDVRRVTTRSLAFVGRAGRRANVVVYLYTVYILVFVFGAIPGCGCSKYSCSIS